MKNLENMKKMIYSLAKSFNATTGIELKELQAEGYLAYCEAVLTYKENQNTKLSTWVFICVKNALIDFCKEEHFHRNCNSLNYYLKDLEKGENELTTTPRQLWGMPTPPFSELYNELTPLAKEVVDVVLEKDHYTGKPKMCRGQVVKDLREKGWAWNKIWSGIKEVKLQLADL